jgi:hypothetical protein
MTDEQLLITDEKIFEFAYTLEIGTETLTDKHGYDFDAYVLSSEELLKFAREMYEEGYDDGCFQATGGQ